MDSNGVHAPRRPSAYPLTLASRELSAGTI
jgi:hypothetical protein